LVEGVGCAGEDFARVAMTVVNLVLNPNTILRFLYGEHGIGRSTIGYVPQDMSLLVIIQLRRPLGVTAMAFSVV
jgi:hypothetical protein